MSNIAWKNIQWSQVQLRISKLQHRIYLSSKNNNKEKTQFLQKLLINSLDAKLLAVKQVTTKNINKKIVSIDNEFYNTDKQKMNLVKKLKIDGKVHLINKAYFSKLEKIQKGPLTISIQEDRAKQYLVLLALEPEWEAKFEPNSYGFRPGRSYHDAVISILESLKAEGTEPNLNKYILSTDLTDFFNKIDHEFLLNKLNTISQIRNQVKAWLEAEIIFEKNLTEFELLEKKSNHLHLQNGIISPFLANIALTGMENYLKNCIMIITEKEITKITNSKQLGIIKYANNLIIIHKDKYIIEKLKILLFNWLSQILKVKLNSFKSSIKCSTEGFIFLGFRFIHLKKHKRMIIKVYPDKTAVINVTKKIGTILRKNRSKSSFDIILMLKPIIINWSKYYSISECSNIFRKLDYLNYQMLRSWVFRRDKRNNRTKVKEKYFPSGKRYYYQGKIYYDNWVLTGIKKLPGNKVNEIFLPKFSWVRRQNHIKINPYASIYDGNTQYWNWRTFEYNYFNSSQNKID